MGKALSRGSRTFLQVAFLEAVIQLALAFGVGITADQHTAIIGVGTIVIAALQAALEEATGKSVLEPAKVKSPADVVQPGG